MDDLRLALKRLARKPGFTFFVAGLLALGIGGSTVMFTLFDAVLLRPLPVSHPNELVRMVQHFGKLLGTRSEFPYQFYRAVEQHGETFAYAFGGTGQFGIMSSPAPAEEIDINGVTSEFFVALGEPALYGRALLPSDTGKVSGTPPAVLSYPFWKARFGGDWREVNRRTIVVNNHTFVIVGVMPRDFHGIAVGSSPDVWIPLPSFASMLSAPVGRMYLNLAARLRPRVARSQAEAECRTIWQSTMRDYYQKIEKLPPASARIFFGRGVSLEPLARGTSILRDRFGGALELLMGCVALLLLIVCSNVAGLLLAQAAARQQEFAVRLAVGATRRALIRQTLSEALILAVLGGAGGFVIAYAGLPLAIRMLPPMRSLSTMLVPLSISLGMNLRVFLVLLAFSALAMLLFSAAPSIAVSRSSIESLLRTARSSNRIRGRWFLIAFQIALCTLLLAIAGLFVRTFQKLRRVDPGINVSHIATFTGDLTGSKESAAFLRTLLGRVREMPGVVSAAASSIGILREHGTFTSVAPAGQRLTRADFMNTATNSVSPGYFATMGMRLVDGRGFTAGDIAKPNQTGPVNAVVNQTFADRFFPGTNPVGKLFGLGMTGIAKDSLKVVGVVNDAKYRTLRERVFPTFYTAPTKFRTFVLNVRTQMRPESIIAPVRKIWESIGPGVPFLEVDTMQQEVDDTTATNRLIAELASLFGALAAVLAGVGTYGLLAYVVTERRREIGIRMALGARPVDVARLIAAQIAALAALGIAIGVAAALVIAPGVQSLLYGISPQDPRSMIAAILLVALTVVAAAVIPVVTAIRTEPGETLRCEN